MTSYEQSDTVRAFVTFRVAGDRLVPDEITGILKTHPTTAYAKGEVFAGQNRNRRFTGKTGVWFLSTDKTVESTLLSDHISFLVSRLVVSRLRPATIRKVTFGARDQSPLTQLAHLMIEKSLTATVTLFWHGAAGARAPSIPSIFKRLLSAIPAKLECDFDSENRGNEEVA